MYAEVKGKKALSLDSRCSRPEYPKSNASANSAIPARALCRLHLWRLNRMAHQITRMAERRSNLLVVLLLTVAVTLWSAGQDAFQLVAVHAPPTACHQHGSTAPDSQPVSYRCCQLGHNSAILQVPLTSRPCVADVTPFGESGHALTITSAHRGLRNLTTLSAGPPNTIPLRV